MSKTLNLVDLLLNSARHLLDIGRTQEALEVLNRLGEFRKLPSPVIEQIQALLAELHLQRKDYARARKHLTIAMTFRPLNAEYHHMMAIAIEEDDQANPRRAEQYFACAVQHDADNPSYWVDYGTYLCRIGKTKSGVKALRQGYALGIQVADIVGRVAETLREEDRFDEATTKLRAALFFNHGDERFRRLWQHHQYQIIHRQQTRQSMAQLSAKKKAVILPFAKAKETGKFLELGARIIRFDQAQPLSDPKAPLPMPFRRRPKG